VITVAILCSPVLAVKSMWKENRCQTWQTELNRELWVNGFAMSLWL
jgi:hypothetical protein